MKHLLTLTFLTIFGLTHAQVPSYVPTNGLLAFYPFNGNNQDFSGFQNDLIQNGNVTYSTNNVGVQQSAAYFENGNNYFLTPTSSWSLINNLPYGTISFWVNIDSQFVSDHYFGIGNSFIVKQKHGVGQDLFFGMQDGTTKIRMYLSGIFPAPGGTDIIGNTSLALNTWYHVIGKWDGIHHSLYINGVLDGQITNSGGIPDRPLPDYFSIGSVLYGWNGNPTLPGGAYGSLDDIGIWNRALTEAEILALYEGCQLAITSQPQDQSVTTSVGVANFSVASSASNPTYQWQTNLGLGFQNISNAGQYTGATSSSLSVSNLSMSNNNQVFRCIVNDGSCVDTTAEASLIIIDDAGIQTNTLPSLKLYPNPVQDVLQIEGLASKEFEFEVLSIDGKLLQKGKSQGEISVKELRKGNYVLRVGQQQVSFVRQ